MSAQTIQFDADIAAIENDVPCEFRFNGIAYSGSRTPITDRQTLEDAGLAQTFDFQLIVRASLFVAPIKPMRTEDEIEVYDTLRGEWISYCVYREPDQAGVAITYGVTQKT